jgi:hypothetical protein
MEQACSQTWRNTYQGNSKIRPGISFYLSFQSIIDEKWTIDCYQIMILSENYLFDDSDKNSNFDTSNNHLMVSDGTKILPSPAENTVQTANFDEKDDDEVNDVDESSSDEDALSPDVLIADTIMEDQVYSTLRNRLTYILRPPQTIPQFRQFLRNDPAIATVSLYCRGCQSCERVKDFR